MPTYMTESTGHFRSLIVERIVTNRSPSIAATALTSSCTASAWCSLRAMVSESPSVRPKQMSLPVTYSSHAKLPAVSVPLLGPKLR